MDTSVSGEYQGEPMSADDRIVHATLTLISEHGLGTVTMSQVIEAASVARQTLYNHYDDIDSIVAKAIGRHNRESLDSLRAALQMAEAPAEKIEQMARHFAMVGSHAGHAFDFGGALSTGVRVALDSYKQAIQQHIRETLQEGLHRGDFRSDLVPDIDTVLTRALLDGIYELAAARPEQAQQVATSGTRTILAALR